MELIDNINNTLKKDLSNELHKGSKLSIAAACFSIYAFQELKKELNEIEELRFIFTSPAFLKEKFKKKKREFYIPRLNRERSLYGTEYEIKLRNELTQKAIAKECVEWIRKKVTFKSNVTTDNMMGFINLDDKNYMPINEFTTVDLGCERGNNAYTMIQKSEAPFSNAYIDLFEALWNDKEKLQEVTDEVIENITTAYQENSPDFIYFVTLYNIFNEFLEDISEDVLPNEATGFKESKIWNMLYNFQKDAALAIINKLEKYNGCILADSVGLGKTFTALAVVKYYENRNKSVLVLCPKKLANNWNTYKDNYINNPIAEDRLRYDVLYHTDLNRTRGTSNGLDLERLNWSNYDLIVIDESHNFRNGGKLKGEDNEKENRYLKLLNKVIRKGVKTKVLMLSATPVNNRFNDLKNQLALAYEGNTNYIDEKLNTTRSIDDIFRNAQRAFNIWSKWDVTERTTENLLKVLDYDFFEVLDSVTIARSRKHIQKYYDTTDIGTFPTRLKPMSLSPRLTYLKEAINYNEIFEQLMLLNLSIYTPTHFILPSKLEKYAEMYEDNKVNVGFTQANREQGIRRLMAINLMKRMESSVFSFNLTLKRIKDLIENTIEIIDRFDKRSSVELDLKDFSDVNEFDGDDLNDDELFTFGKKVKINLVDMDYKSWKNELEKDKEVLELLTLMVGDITPKYDSKLQKLLKVIDNKMTNPINEGNKKIIIFTAFSDTAGYLYDHVSEYVKEKYNLNAAMVTGTVDGKTTAPLKKRDLNTVLTCFSPVSKDKKLLMPNSQIEIDVLIATDCISEGQNLQDCDYLINYDIHWNPVRIIQRFGRIDRIGSRNKYIQLVNFWPDVTLDEYIDLKAKVETRMKIVDMTATGDDNILSEEEKTDLEYRKSQLKRLKEEVVDIEDMSTGISIMDLGLNEFRLDLLEYIKHHHDMDKTPYGLHSVVPASEETPTGVIYVLKNRSNSVNIDNQNRLHPFYMVYITNDGEVICDHLSPKQMLDKMRFLCKGKEEPIPGLYKAFNKETRDGRNMSKFSKLLGQAISSIIEVKEESDIESFLSGGEVNFLNNQIKGLDDFELICFLVVR
ncbi:helicase-related protein [Amedibacterium intestinale]|uniref:helicase-related protein n=1 Tax=Amedibacterium intestinale TaxID=2583452 RepID=UPI000E4C91CA|nr:helicase-related protein [Amedibacterium intestinale]RHO29400.1 ATP-dependent helicase [Erysipelotrichaceae bacterium AM17-60]